MRLALRPKHPLLPLEQRRANPKPVPRQNPKPKPEEKERNPSAAATAIGLVLVVGGIAGGAYAYNRSMKKKEAKAKRDPAHALAGVYSKDATMADYVVGQITLPIYLRSGWDPSPGQAGDVTTGDELAYLAIKMPDMPADGGVGMKPGLVTEIPYLAVGEDVLVGDTASDLSPAAALKRLVTNLSAGAARAAWDRAIAELTAGTIWADEQARDAVTQKIAQVVAQKADWTHRLDPYSWGDPFSRTWSGIQLIAALAQQSFMNAKVAG